MPVFIQQMQGLTIFLFSLYIVMIMIMTTLRITVFVVFLTLATFLNLFLGLVRYMFAITIMIIILTFKLVALLCQQLPPLGSPCHMDTALHPGHHHQHYDYHHHQHHHHQIVSRVVSSTQWRQKSSQQRSQCTSTPWFGNNHDLAWFADNQYNGWLIITDILICRYFVFIIFVMYCIMPMPLNWCMITCLATRCWLSSCWSWRCQDDDGDLIIMVLSLKDVNDYINDNISSPVLATCSTWWSWTTLAAIQSPPSAPSPCSTWASTGLACTPRWATRWPWHSGMHLPGYLVSNCMCQGHNPKTPQVSSCPPPVPHWARPEKSLLGDEKVKLAFDQISRSWQPGLWRRGSGLKKRTSDRKSCSCRW